MLARSPRPRFACLCAAIALLGASAEAASPPPRNPYLADSSYPVGHGTSAQQDTVAVAGPRGPGRTLAADEIRYAPVGPGHFGSYTSGPYPDGRRVLWSNGLDRIVKLDHATFEVLASRPFEGAPAYTESQAEASLARMDRWRDGLPAIATSLWDARKLRNLSGVYTLLDMDHIYYIGDKQGGITAWADADSRDPASAIEPRATFQLPADVTGLLVGMNMTFDGWIVVATEHGYLVTLSRDFQQVRQVRLRHAEGAEEKATFRTGFGWVRNGFAIDRAGGIYVASQDHLHKVVWTGDRLSTDPADGAWTARYANGWGHGTGATPSLMGFGDEDRFVVITDGEPVMNVVLFWRDTIPADWQAPAGAPDGRIAGMLPANLGDPDLEVLQSEQSVVVAGTGALVVNNVPRNVPWYVPNAAKPLLAGFLGSSPRYQPFGVQKFEWDPFARRLRQAWTNREISSPNSVPLVSLASNAVYLVGARQDRWTLEALDWSTGKERFHFLIGGQRYNSLFSGTLLDEAGRIHYGTHWGRVRLDPKSVPH
jgi:hypothetical protein